MDPVIETSGLTRQFGPIRAVDGLDLAVGAGEMFALVGPDGAGKTTTIRMLCGILKPTAGSVRVLGRDLVNEAALIKNDIGYLSQRFSLYGDLTVDENIEFFAEIHKVRDYKKRRGELLDFTRLAPFRTRLAERLSGGMRQKLALACTLIHTPRLLLLDEPTTGVDPVSRRDFWKILSSLLRTGITIFMSTPYLDEAERCSRVGLMNNGRLLAADTPQAVKRLMKGEVVEVICGEIRRAFDLLRGRPDAGEVQIFGDRLNLVVDNTERDFPAVAARLREAGIEVSDWRKIPPSLENVFISVTRDPKKGERS
ncbi:MAG: ABC transporter ATP-binding protein [Candidatus Aminicenantes bacterium]|nr:ABC transporter ATP-binding protein [Candidatus Aminicenantes bacterium]